MQAFFVELHRRLLIFLVKGNGRKNNRCEAKAFHTLITNPKILAFYYQITPRFMSLISRGDAIAAFRASVVEEIYKQGGTSEDVERLTSDVLKKAMRLKRSPEVVARSF